MKKIAFMICVFLLCFTTIVYARSSWNEGPLRQGKNQIRGDSNTGIYFDPDNDGVTEITMTVNGGINLTRSGECKIEMTDDAQTSHSLTIDSGGDLYIDGIKKT